MVARWIGNGVVMPCAGQRADERLGQAERGEAARWAAGSAGASKIEGDVLGSANAVKKYLS